MERKRSPRLKRKDKMFEREEIPEEIIRWQKRIRVFALLSAAVGITTAVLIYYGVIL